MKTVFKFLVAYVALSALLMGLKLLLYFPSRPISWSDWLHSFVLIVPLVMALEFLGERMFSNPVSQAVERHTKNQRFSWVRILVNLVVMLMVCAAVLGLYFLFA